MYVINETLKNLCKYKVDLYESAVRWLNQFREWKAWGAADLDTTITQEDIPESNECHIVFETKHQATCTDGSYFNGIVTRFFCDPVAVLFAGLQLQDYSKWKSIFMTVYSGVIRPFGVAKRVEQTLPKELPRNVLLTVHHRSWNMIDSDCQPMNFVSHIYKSQDVIMKYEFNFYGFGTYFVEKLFAGKPMLKSPHWSILENWLNGISNDEEYTASKYQRCMTIVPDRDSQQIENDVDVGFGLGTYALSLALKVPILDLATVCPLHKGILQGLENPQKQRCEMPVMEVRSALLNHALDDPQFSHVEAQDISQASEQSYDAWRKKYDTEIKAFACIAKKKFLQLAHIDQPMCPIIAQKKYPEQVLRGKVLAERYGCPVEGPHAEVPPNYTELQNEIGAI